MTVHLIKLCVGVDSIEHLERLEEGRIARAERETGRRFTWHVTRRMPKRRDELLDDGSLYWVIRGYVKARQRLLDIREVTDGEGRAAALLELDPEIVPVQPRPHRPFQGWRYLEPGKAPQDMRDAPDGAADMPEWMQAELRDLGLL